MTTEMEPPKLEYPCDYPIKVMGYNEHDFTHAVIEVIRRHDPGFNPASVALRASRNEKFLSVTVTITATGPEQIAALFADLKATGRVQMVL
jgi:putative lipoic acid-binding regulatory protein